MSRTTRVLAASAVAASLMALPAAAQAAAHPSQRDAAAKRIVVQVSDKRGDVHVVNLDNVDLSGSGSGSVSAALQKAALKQAATKKLPSSVLDLLKVTYTITRTGAQPSLRIRYHFAGKLPAQMTSTGSGSYSITTDAQGNTVVHSRGAQFTTQLGSSQWDISYDTTVASNRLTLTKESDGRYISCTGLKSTARAGGHNVTVSVPLACINRTGIKAARLATRVDYTDTRVTIPAGSLGFSAASAVSAVSALGKVLADDTGSSGDGSDPLAGMKVAGFYAADKVRPTRVLPLTRR